MAKSYSECSSQTIQNDPDDHLKNYERQKLVSSCEIQTDPCDLDACRKEDSHRRKSIDTGLDDQSDDDSSSLNQKQELQRRLNPARKEDFETLQSELLRWRSREERKITITGRGEDQKQEMKRVLLKKEAHLLRKIDQLKNCATEKCKTKKIEQMMEEMSQPKQWEVSSGAVIGVDTPETCRAREMKAMYDELNKKVDKVDDRIKLLESIKGMVETLDQSGLAKDVGALLDRELQMLHRGTDLGPEFMDGMRKRLSNQFTKLLVTRLNSDANRIPQTKVKFQIHKPDAIAVRKKGEP